MKDWKLGEIIIDVGVSRVARRFSGKTKGRCWKRELFGVGLRRNWIIHLLLKVPLSLIYLLKHVLNYLHIEATHTTES